MTAFTIFAKAKFRDVREMGGGGRFRLSKNCKILLKSLKFPFIICLNSSDMEQPVFQSAAPRLQKKNAFKSVLVLEIKGVYSIPTHFPTHRQFLLSKSKVFYHAWNTPLVNCCARTWLNVSLDLTSSLTLLNITSTNSNTN